MSVNPAFPRTPLKDQLAFLQTWLRIRRAEVKEMEIREAELLGAISLSNEDLCTCGPASRHPCECGR